MNAWHHLIGRHLEAGRGERIAIRSPEATWSYAQLAEQSARAATLLAAAGVGPGDRVLALCDDTPALVALVLGAWRRGAVMVLGNVLSVAAEAAFLIEDTGAKALVVSAPASPNLVAAVRHAWFSGAGDPGALPRLEEALASAPPGSDCAAVAPGDPALWQYTQLADGASLPVVHSHGAVVAGADPFARGRLDLHAGDACYSIAKLYFGYGFGNSLVFPLAVGATAIVRSGRSDVFAALECIERERPSVFFAVPTFYAAMLRIPELTARYDLAAVRAFVSAGEELGPSLAARFRSIVGAPLVNGLGSTEMFHIFLSTPVGDDTPEGSVGLPTPGHAVRLLGPDGVEVVEGEEGELWVRGPHNGDGYARDSERSARAFRDGWVRVGDRARRHPSGHLLYRGRTDGIVMVGGQKVVIAEVEAALAAHPDVRAARVVPQVNEDRLVQLHATVTLRPALAADREVTRALRAFLRQRLLPHKCPAAIECREGSDP